MRRNDRVSSPALVRMAGVSALIVSVAAFAVAGICHVAGLDWMASIFAVEGMGLDALGMLFIVVGLVLVVRKIRSS